MKKVRLGKIQPPYFLILLSLAALFVITAFSNLFAQEENLSVLSGWLHYTDNSNALYHFMSAQAFDLLDKREALVGKISTKAQWLARQVSIRKTLDEIVGPFPARTPLNARVVGKINRDFCTIEKIIYESQPQFYVTACLFLPKNRKGKTPAIIYCSGHTKDGFRSKTYQRVILNLVKKGFIVFAFDPVGQGERLQYYDPDSGESRVGGPTLEHSYPGAQCFVLGSSQARYMIWDGIRAVDYLLTRQEVDRQRIGITGRSGGGTQSAYIAAFDNRILAAAPECYITSMRRLWQSIGPQDAEQNFYHGIASGLDHADLLEVRAPKPTLMITTTRDFFSIQGTRETAREVRRAFEAFGVGNNFNMVEDDSVHASTRKNREAMYAFFQKYLNLPGDPTDEDIAPLSGDELTVTRSGQVATSLGGKTVFRLNKKQAKRLSAQLEQLRKSPEGHLANARAAAAKLSGFIVPAQRPKPVFTGRYRRTGYAVEKYFIAGEGDYPIPLLLMVPNSGGKHPALLYLHPQGKSAEADKGGEMEWFVKRGYVVLAPDLLGFGEMGGGTFRGDSYRFKIGKASYNMWFASILIGRSITGILAGDVVRLVNYLSSRADVDAERIAALAQGDLCAALLHAAALDGKIERIALKGPLISYRCLVMNEYYQPHYVLTAVAGALTAYDLPDLYALVAPRPLLLIDPVDEKGEKASGDLLDSELQFARLIYEKHGIPGRLGIRFLKDETRRDDLFGSWIY